MSWAFASPFPRLLANTIFPFAARDDAASGDTVACLLSDDAREGESQSRHAADERVANRRA
jgi:hypothetical protein